MAGAGIPGHKSFLFYEMTAPPWSNGTSLRLIFQGSMLILRLHCLFEHGSHGFDGWARRNLRKIRDDPFDPCHLCSIGVAMPFALRRTFKIPYATHRRGAPPCVPTRPYICRDVPSGRLYRCHFHARCFHHRSFILCAATSRNRERDDRKNGLRPAQTGGGGIAIAIG